MVAKYERNVDHIWPTAITVWRRMIVVQHIVQQYFCKIDHEDGQIWSLTLISKFTVSSVWDEVREKDAVLGSRKLIWDKRLPCKILIFMWKMLNEFLPFPDILNLLGFQLPPKWFL